MFSISASLWKNKQDLLKSIMPSRNFICSNIPERIKERDVFDEFEIQIDLHSLLTIKVLQ